MFQQRQWRQAVTPIALAIVSLIAALGLWVAVTESENPRSVQEPPLTIPVEAVNVPSGLAARNISPNAIVVKVNATDEDFERLTSANFEATVDMTGGTATTTSRVVTVQVAGINGVDVAEITPTLVDVTLEGAATKEVPVQVNRLGALAPGFRIESTQASPQNVQVSGAGSIVDLVESVVADINLTGRRSSIEQEFRLTPRDASGADLPRITVEPSSAQIRLSVIQQESTLVLPVRIDTQGSTAEGYNLVSIGSTPEVVSVTGPQEALQAISALETETIDLNAARDDIIRSVPLVIPQGLQASRDSVNVTIRIDAAPGDIVLTVAPVVTDIPEGLQAVLQTTFLSVRLRGEQPRLIGLTPSDLEATVSAEGLGEGVHVLEVQVTAPPDVQIVAVQPVLAVVNLQP